MEERAEKIRSYSELSQLSSFEERFDYLKLHGQVGYDTFGYDRYLNQQFYRSKEWQDVRNKVILRDGACDLGIDNCPINGKVMIHHMNPLSANDITESTEQLLNPEYLICVSMDTHNAIHYGTREIVNKNKVIEREPNDTCPWRK